MKIHSIYYSKAKKQEFECVVHIENKRITKVTSISSEDFKEEFEKLQPSIFGTENFILWKNKQDIKYPYYIIYKSNFGQKQLLINYSKINFLITKQLLKIKNNYILTYFIVVSFLVLIGIFMNIMNGEFVLSEMEILLFIWGLVAILILWHFSSKIEKREKEIISLKKKIIESQD